MTDSHDNDNDIPSEAEVESEIESEAEGSLLLVPSPPPAEELDLVESRSKGRTPAIPSIKLLNRYPAQINPTLELVCKSLPGGRRGLLELLRTASATQPDAARFLDKWFSFRGKPNVSRVSWDDICVECGFEWTKLVTMALEAALTTNHHLAAMKAAVALPEVVDKMVKFAKRKDGVKDREMLFRHSNFLPVPAGTTVSIVNQVAARAQASNSPETLVPFEKDVIDAEEDGRR